MQAAIDIKTFEEKEDGRNNKLYKEIVNLESNTCITAMIALFTLVIVIFVYIETMDQKQHAEVICKHETVLELHHLYTNITDIVSRVSNLEENAYERARQSLKEQWKYVWNDILVDCRDQSKESDVLSSFLLKHMVKCKPGFSGICLEPGTWDEYEAFYYTFADSPNLRLIRTFYTACLNKEACADTAGRAADTSYLYVSKD